MSEYVCSVSWKARDDEDFARGRYSRAHTWNFDGGVTIAASAAPASVRPPFSDPSAVDPEEAFVASISSCHMLTYLYLASKEGFIVESYNDDAKGFMIPGENGVPWVAEVLLRPRIAYRPGAAAGAADEARLHHLAHEQCYIANSVRTRISVEPAPL
jgi:organic hydroperoxide reductase OsmC/OhrA